MRKISLMVLAGLAFAACDNSPKFNIQGNISDAEGKTLYLEAAALDGVTLLDSVTLKSNGTFSFKSNRPESPDFYRLRVDDKVINLSIDSTETVTVNAPYAEFSTAYTVSGSENNVKIKELTLKQVALQNSVNKLITDLRTNLIAYDEFETKLSELVEAYKTDVKMNYIFASPRSTYAYFALFQKLNDYLIFDPLNNKEDIKCFAAVATSLNNDYPHATRSKNLYNIVIKGMKNTRKPQQKVVEIPEDKVVETGVIDIALRDMKGDIRKLTDLKGKVVLLDFTVYQTQAGAPHNLMLRELYNKYSEQGLEIYQVSLDADEHYWKTAAENLPWICVRDGNGIYSTFASLYNVQQVPSYFLVSRANVLDSRGEDIKDLDAAIKALL